MKRTSSIPALNIMGSDVMRV